MATPKYYEGQEFENPEDPTAPVLVYKAGKFIPKPTAGQVSVAPDALQSGQAVLAAIDAARKAASWKSTGLVGGMGAKIAGTPGYNLDRTADTIKGNLMFGKLAELKAAAANGASGMGSLSDSEGRILASLAGSVDVGQAEPQFRQNLDKVRQHVLRSTPGVNIDVPLDLSNGASRDTAPRGAFYRDPQGNIRRNDNGDKGNPILRAAQQSSQTTAGAAAPSGSGLKPGHVEDGYQYLGGPSGDPKSWRKVQ